MTFEQVFAAELYSAMTLDLVVDKLAEGMKGTKGTFPSRNSVFLGCKVCHKIRRRSEAW